MDRIKTLEHRVTFLNSMAALLVFFAISLMLTNQICSEKWDVYLDKEKKLIDNIRIYENASNYLTKEIFAYINSLDDKYYKNYTEEAYKIKRREMAISNIKTIDIGEEEERLADSINSYSTELMKLEEASLNLIKLGKINEAKKNLFSIEYENKANNITNDVKRFEKLVRKNIRKHLDYLETILNLTFIGEIIISVLIIIISPLRNKTTVELLYIDPLTRKYNRSAFEKHINKYENKIKGIVFLDVNDLKKVNDTLGHKAGDKLLLNISDCIQKTFNKYGTSYRISGDEFVVILYKDVDEKDLTKKFDDECKEFSKKLGNKISASCGIAMQDSKNPINKDKLYFMAEESMYKAKAGYYKESGNDRRIR